MIAGIEIGGTKLQVTLAETNTPQRLLTTCRWPVERARGAAGILAQLELGLDELLGDQPLAAIGIGFGGPVQQGESRVITSHQVAGWDQFALGDWCRSRWPVPIALGNDCNVAALAEAQLGAGQGTRRMLYVTVGTGIGGGLVVDGRVDAEQRPASAEIGHLRPGLNCAGPQQTVESMASGLGLERTAEQALADPDAWGFSKADAAALRLQLGDPISTRGLAEAARNGDPLATALLDHAAEVLGWALAQATTLMSPERIVVGGGVSLIGPTFHLAVRRAWEQFVFPPLRNECDLTASATRRGRGALRRLSPGPLVDRPDRGVIGRWAAHAVERERSRVGRPQHDSARLCSSARTSGKGYSRIGSSRPRSSTSRR